MNNLSDVRGKILVVDDEKSTVDALKISLESDNYDVVEWRRSHPKSAQCIIPRYKGLK